MKNMKSSLRSLIGLLIILSQIKLSPLGQWVPSLGPGQPRLVNSYGSSGNPAAPQFQQIPTLYRPQIDQAHGPGLREIPGQAINFNSPHLSNSGAPQNLQLPLGSPDHHFPGSERGNGHLLNNPHNRYLSFGSSSSSSLPSNSKSISGDYCFEPLLTCDTTNTVLYCIQGRCTCPNQWTLSPGTLPLNTVWHPELRKCVSVVGSGCHMVTSSYPAGPLLPPSSSSSPVPAAQYSEPTPPTTQTRDIATTIIKGLIGIPSSPPAGTGYGYVHCQPGIRCVRHPGYQEVGICAGCRTRVQILAIFATTALHIIIN